MSRTIKRVLPSSTVNMGGGLLTRQPIPGDAVQQLDPFLLVHHTGPKAFAPENQGLPFAPHPHKGFETVTFIFEGAVEHKDSTGHHSTIHTGGVQWMTAGRGIVHSENLPKEFIENGGTVEYIQLWVNLPARFKSVPAKYQGVQKEDIPEIVLPENGGKIRIIAGSYQGSKGPAQSITGIEAFELYIPSGKTVEFPVETDRQILFYLLNGSVTVDDRTILPYQAVQFQNDADSISFTAEEDTRILLCTGIPINEPVVAHGPFVMNTQTEIMEAIRDYQTGKMGMVIN